MRKFYLLTLLAFIPLLAFSADRERLNFNGGWLMHVGDVTDGEGAAYNDASWKPVTLPRAFNEDEAFRVSIENLTDTVVWYRKHFTVSDIKRRKFFIEFEGVRFGADFWLNGHKLGISENGVMASGFDLTPYIRKGTNVIAVRTDNSWDYRERATGQRYQWNDKNFNANYGGIPKNVWLHVTGLLYQTLPLYSSLQTTGTYIYGTDYDIAGRAVTVNAESQVRNDDRRPHSFTFVCKVMDADGRQIGSFTGDRCTLQPGQTRTVKVSGRLAGVHFWSWGYGYLYTVKTLLQADDGTTVDANSVRTGFRKTRFGDGKIWLNDRVMMVHGYAQRSSNEWPGVGIDVPAWLSDYSNGLQVASGGNMVRWMHVTPSKQDIESCDRMGLPACVAEHLRRLELPDWDGLVARAVDLRKVGRVVDDKADDDRAEAPVARRRKVKEQERSVVNDHELEHQGRAAHDGDEQLHEPAQRGHAAAPAEHHKKSERQRAEQR